MNKYIKTASLSALEKINGGIIYLLPEIFVKFFTLIPLIFLWKLVISTGVQVGMSMDQMISYTYISAILSDMMVVKTPASGWLSEGVLLKLYGRPASVLGQLASITVGGWIPNLLLFSVPMILFAPIFGVVIIPESAWFFLSLFLCITLGFSIDILFACLSIKLRNMNWLISRIRMAVVAFLSGTVIPIKLLPLGLAEVMKYQPFASLGGAPLSVFVGSADIIDVITIQLFWNILLLPLALFAFYKSQEGMVSYGG